MGESCGVNSVSLSDCLSTGGFYQHVFIKSHSTLKGFSTEGNRLKVRSLQSHCWQMLAGKSGLFFVRDFYVSCPSLIGMFQRRHHSENADVKSLINSH